MTERRELAIVDACHEAAEPAAGDILEKHPLDGVFRTEAENLIPLRLDEFLGHCRKTLGENPETVVRAVFPRRNP